MKRKPKNMYRNVIILMLFICVIMMPSQYYTLVSTFLPSNNDEVALASVNRCLQPSLLHLCLENTREKDNDKTPMDCALDPNSFFGNLTYSPSKTELKARDQLIKTNIDTLGIGSGRGSICSTVAPNMRTLCTDRPNLDLFAYGSWLSILKGRPEGFSVISAEHVLEHFEPVQISQLAAAVFTALKPGGTFRIAVPDGYKPSLEYQAYIRPGSTPSNKGQHHMVAYTVDSLPPIFRSLGFQIYAREFFDSNGDFHTSEEVYENDNTLGKIDRSYHHDHRNKNQITDKSTFDFLKKDLRLGEPVYTSLWFDAVKPTDCPVWTPKV